MLTFFSKFIQFTIQPTICNRGEKMKTKENKFHFPLTYCFKPLSLNLLEKFRFTSALKETCNADWLFPEYSATYEF